MADYFGTVQADAALTRLIRQYSDFNTISKYVKEGIQEYAITDLDAKTQDNLSNRILKRRSGALAQSVRWRTRKVRGQATFTLTALSGTPYGAILEHGGTIKPRNSKFLTIPLPAAKTPAGVLKKPAREWDDTFFHRSKAGNLVLLQSRGDKVVPLFLLVKQVKIPAFHWAFRSFEETQHLISERIAARLPV